MKTSNFKPKADAAVEYKTPAEYQEQAASYAVDAKAKAERFDVAHHTAPNRAERRKRERQGYNRANGRANTPLERS